MWETTGSCGSQVENRIRRLLGENIWEPTFGRQVETSARQLGDEVPRFQGPCPMQTKLGDKAEDEVQWETQWKTQSQWETSWETQRETSESGDKVGDKVGDKAGETQWETQWETK